MKPDRFRGYFHDEAKLRAELDAIKERERQERLGRLGRQPEEEPRPPSQARSRAHWRFGSVYYYLRRHRSN